MKGISVPLVTSIALLIFAVSAYADGESGTGNELITSCNDTNYQATNELWTYCVGYINGIDEGLGVGFDLGVASVKPSTKNDVLLTVRALVLRYCIPDNATRQQRALVVSKYLKDHPESLNEQGAVLIQRAFENAWPCAK